MSPRDAFSAIGNVTYEMGCGDVLCHNDTYVYKAVEAAKHADTTIIVVGITDVSIGTEDKDRVDLLLPGYQTHLVNQIAKATTAPIILVVCVVTVVALSTFLLLGTTPGLNPSCGLVFRVRKVETPLQMLFMGSTILVRSIPINLLFHCSPQYNCSSKLSQTFYKTSKIIFKNNISELFLKTLPK